MPYRPVPFSDVEEHALRLDGLSWRHGSLLWPSSAPPLREERASLVREAIPSWAIAAGLTAGWVWTGMGAAEPFDVLAPPTPAISPIARTRWKPRFHRGEKRELRVVAGLSLLSPADTQRDLLRRPEGDPSIVAQLWSLEEDYSLPLPRIEGFRSQDAGLRRLDRPRVLPITRGKRL